MKKLSLILAVCMIASSTFAQVGALRLPQQIGQSSGQQKERVVPVKPNTVVGAGETKADLKAVAAPICFKYSVTAAQIAAIGAATSGNHKLTDLPARAIVLNTLIKHSTAVAGGAAKGTLTSDATAPSDGDTVTIGSKVYTFKTALTPTEGQVLIGVSAATALDNLKSAINHTGTPDTDYKAAAVHPTVTATTNTDTTQVVVAKTPGTGGNAIVTTEAGTHTSWGAATLEGGGTLVTASTARVITANHNYGTAFNVFQAPGATVLDSDLTPFSETFASATVLNLAMTTTGDNLDTVTAGAIDVWITYLVRPLAAY